ncbi:hypothetical protein [Paenibacillus jiagnxiensis]|uniref:hypothetical protein n=1 Tax=Paenibacillus jiagnxiensis TaxID=3228926 RepID=UPI0034817059
MQRMKEVQCKTCFKKIATINTALNVIEEEGGVSRSNSSYPVGPNDVEEVKLICKCGHVTTFYGG